MTKIATWLKDAEQDIEMGEHHIPFWQTMIRKAVPYPLSQKTVFDFGCGCGAFLKTLFQENPFEVGYGIDLAEDSIKIANRNRGELPIAYYVSGSEPNLKDKIDVAFSYEVIYLIPDLNLHAQYMQNLLKPGASYFAATGCHTSNPLWANWRSVISQKSALPVANYAPEDFMHAFSAQGFTVSGQQLGFDGFLPLNLHPDYYPTVQDTINYYRRDIIVFQFTKSM